MSLGGQSIPEKTLRAVLRSGKLSHAYLFKGPEGSGKRLLAKEFARGVLCDNLRKVDFQETPCGECWSCREMLSGAHPDFFQVERDGVSIKIKASHDIVKEAFTKPYHSSRKVFLIPEAGDMTPEAANALLKVLEEPPSYVTFILTTANVKKVPETVVSRCQVIPFRALSRESLVEMLVAQHGMSEEKARFLAEYADGNVERALLMSSSREEHPEVEAGEAPDTPLQEGERLIREALSMSPIDLAVKYSKMDAEARSRLLLLLEIRLWREIKSIIDGGRDIRDWDIRGINRPSDFYQATRCVMTAKARMRRNTNAFLTLAVMFMDLRRFLSRAGLAPTIQGKGK